MKTTIILSSLLAASFAFAQAPATAPAATTAAPAKKMSYKEAKAACHKENKALKGAELQKCIQEKKTM